MALCQAKLKLVNIKVANISRWLGNSFRQPIRVLDAPNLWLFAKPSYAYSEAIVRGLDILSGFIIGGHNLKHIKYGDETVLMVETEKNSQLS